MLIGSHKEPDEINLNGTEITSNNNKKLIGVLIDKKINFDIQTNSLWKKRGQKLSALARVRSYLTLVLKFLLVN